MSVKMNDMRPTLKVLLKSMETREQSWLRLGNVR